MVRVVSLGKLLLSDFLMYGWGVIFGVCGG